MTTTSTPATENAARYLMNNYGSRDLCLVRGEGIYVYDDQGNRYLDLLSGLGVNNLGHCHPKVTRALHEQADRLLHVSNLYLIEPQIKLARLLVEHSPADRVFFCNSGAEAAEAAIKMARRHAHDRHGPGKETIVTLTNSFHGRTLGAMSATGQPKYHQGFQPIVQGFRYSPVNDLEALRQAVDETVCAVMLEPVQGEGGIFPCTVAFAQEARRLCDQYGALLIFDEVQCGLGRAGHLFASEDFGIEPDAITLAKSLAGGVPIGAMLAKEEPSAALTAGTHASTFGGNPLASAAGVAAFSTIVDEKLPQRSKEIGAAFFSRLLELQSRFSVIREVRGCGLMIGMEFHIPVAPLIKALRAQGILAGPAGPHVLRFLPPLIIEPETLESVLPPLHAWLEQNADG